MVVFTLIPPKGAGDEVISQIPNVDNKRKLKTLRLIMSYKSLAHPQENWFLQYARSYPCDSAIINPPITSLSSA